ncbi:MAG: hypothetical protein V4644_01870 [Patescibacteria group bacterium]
MLSINGGDPRAWCAQLKMTANVISGSIEDVFEKALADAKAAQMSVPDADHYGDYRSSPASAPHIPCFVRRFCAKVLALKVIDTGSDTLAPWPPATQKVPKSTQPPMSMMVPTHKDLRTHSM